QGASALAGEFEKLGREEREQYEIIALGTAGRALPELAGWELGCYFGGVAVGDGPAPRSVADALAIALGFERRTQSFYNDVATNARADAVRAFAAEMSADEQRHIARLKLLLQHENALAALGGDDEAEPADGDGLPLS